MKHLQKSLSLFLCIILCLAFFPFSAAYAEEADSEGVASDQAEIPILEEIDTTGETKLKDDSLVTEEEDDSVSETVMKEDLEWTLDDGGAIVYGKDELFSEEEALEATGEGTFSAATAAAYTIDLPTYIVVPPTLEDVSDETMLVDYTIEYQHTLRCILENYDIFWYFKPSTGPIGHISWWNEIEGIKYEYMLWIFDTNLTMDPYEQNREIVSTENFPDGSWLQTRYDFSGNVIIATYSPSGTYTTYSWDAALQTWAIDNSESGNTEYCDFDGLTPYHVPFCAVHFTGETLVLWDGGGSHGDTNSNGLVLDDDGVFRYYENGAFVPKTGIVDYQGGSFFVADGVLCSDANGLAEFGGTWYFLSQGQIQKQYSGLAQYDGEWFYIENGILNTTNNGLIPYDGGQFLVAVGRICYDVSGLWLNSANIGGDNRWYFLSNGQVQTQYSGVVMYDGAFFVVENGVLNENYNGIIKYDGKEFYVKNGQLTGEVEPTKTEYMVINGKKYLAVYYGQQDISRWGECTYRDFWRLENAYDDFKNARLFGDNLPANNYVMPVEVGQVYVIDYYQKDGRAFREVMRCDGNLFDGQLSTHAVAVDAPIYTETMSIGGRKYNASYFGQWILPPFSPYVNRSFWRLENAYNDFKDNRFAGESLYESNYPMAIKAGQVYVIDYTLRSGGTDRKIMRNDGIIKDGMQQTYAIIVE